MPNDWPTLLRTLPPFPWREGDRAWSPWRGYEVIVDRAPTAGVCGEWRNGCSSGGFLDRGLVPLDLPIGTEVRVLLPEAAVALARGSYVVHRDEIGVITAGRRRPSSFPGAGSGGWHVVRFPGLEDEFVWCPERGNAEILPVRYPDRCADCGGWGGEHDRECCAGALAIGIDHCERTGFCAAVVVRRDDEGNVAVSEARTWRTPRSETERNRRLAAAAREAKRAADDAHRRRSCPECGKPSPAHFLACKRGQRWREAQARGYWECPSCLDWCRPDQACGCGGIEAKQAPAHAADRTALQLWPAAKAKGAASTRVRPIDPALVELMDEAGLTRPSSTAAEIAAAVPAKRGTPPTQAPTLARRRTPEPPPIEGEADLADLILRDG